MLSKTPLACVCYTYSMHTEESALSRLLRDAESRVEVGARYAHYKHPEKTYVVTGIGLMESAEEAAVLYTAEYGARLTWVRPLSNWLEEVVVEGTEVPRFQKLIPS